MSKKDLPKYFDSEAHLVAFLDDIERSTLADFPRADDPGWRFKVQRTHTMHGEKMALNVLVLARDLRDRLKAGGMPAWEAIGRGMMLHDHMTACKFPEFLSMRGKFNAEKRKPKDGPVLTVLAYLKHMCGKTWKQSLRTIEETANTRTSINGVEIRRGRRKEEIQFLSGSESASYKTATIERKFYALKADP